MRDLIQGIVTGADNYSLGKTIQVIAFVSVRIVPILRISYQPSCARLELPKILREERGPSERPVRT